MVKREYLASDETDEHHERLSRIAPPGSLARSEGTLSSPRDIKPPRHMLDDGCASPQLVNPTTPAPKKTRMSKKQTGDKATGKARWTAEEDAIVIGMMEKVIKENIWGLAKADGRLVSRTSYGVQYHALMLLKQGVGKAGSSGGKGAKGT